MMSARQPRVTGSHELGCWPFDGLKIEGLGIFLLFIRGLEPNRYGSRSMAWMQVN